MLKIVFFVPETDLESVKEAMFEAGAGKIGNYDQCCWQVKGEGQFRPLAGSNPALGKHDALEKTDEYRVELVCDDHRIQNVIAAFKRAHPYEEPAYDVYPLMTIDA